MDDLFKDLGIDSLREAQMRESLLSEIKRIMRPEGASQPDHYQDVLEHRALLQKALRNDRYGDIACQIIALSQARGEWVALNEREIDPILAREMADPNRGLLERTEDGLYHVTDLTLDYLPRRK